MFCLICFFVPIACNTIPSPDDLEEGNATTLCLNLSENKYPEDQLVGLWTYSGPAIREWYYYKTLTKVKDVSDSGQYRRFNKASFNLLKDHSLELYDYYSVRGAKKKGTWTYENNWLTFIIENTEMTPYESPYQCFVDNIESGTIILRWEQSWSGGLHLPFEQDIDAAYPHIFDIITFKIAIN